MKIEEQIWYCDETRIGKYLKLKSCMRTKIRLYRDKLGAMRALS